MHYPVRLLPGFSNQNLISSPDLQEHLIRWTNPDYPLHDEQGKLTALAIEEKRLFHYSVNKTPWSEVEDVFIEFVEKAPFTQPWEKGMEPLEVKDEDFIRIESRGFFFILIGEIQGHIGQYPFPADKQEYDCHFTVKVVHAPLRANFMHFELHIFDKDGNLMSDLNKKNWRKIIVSELRQHLIRIAKFQI